MDAEKLEVRLLSLAAFWDSEGKRCYEIAHRRAKLEESVMAQAVRFWECAREMREAIAETKHPTEGREERAAHFILDSGKKTHTSDCATSVAPAEEPGPCDCDAKEPPNAD